MRLWQRSRKIVEDGPSLREEISIAIYEGLAYGPINTQKLPVLVRGTDENQIFVYATKDPIRVLDDDVIIPDELAELAVGIRLDVQAILADRAEGRDN